MNENNTQGQVNPLYMEQSDLLKHKAVVTKIGAGEINKKKYRWIQLNETIFHPKRGGVSLVMGLVA